MTLTMVITDEKKVGASCKQSTFQNSRKNVSIIIDEANINFRQSRFEEPFVKETSVGPAISSISCCHFDSQGEISCRNQRNFPLPGFHRAEFRKAGRAANMATGKDNIEPRPYLISNSMEVIQLQVRF